MKISPLAGFPAILIAFAFTTPMALAKRGNKAPQIQLTEVGENLEAQYSDQLKLMQSEIVKAVPALNKSKIAAYQKSRQAEIDAKLALEAAMKKQGELAKAEALVNHAKGKWIGGADKGIETAQKKIKAAKTDEERETAEKELANWQKNREEGVKALKERQAAYDEAVKNKGDISKALEQAKSDLTQSKANTLRKIKELGLSEFLSNHTLDADLAAYQVLHHATPRVLAAYAQQGAEQKKRIDVLLANEDLLVQIAVADGAANGHYGQAMEIYDGILKASAKAGKGNLQRLALAVSLEHAVPIKQRNAVGQTDAPAHVDPVKRYLHYEKAFLAGELDPAFKDLSVWDYRMVVDGEEPDYVLAWGREMLRNYRPDHVTMDDYRWRYVALVRSDIRYGSQDNKYDRDDLQFFQNILMNGGICGRRAFIGRFILRAFGVPTTARPQRGHAALAHWTPDGWVVCLGAGWGKGWTKTQYQQDLDFLATTQARAVGDSYLMVERAQWIGDAMGEKPVYGFLSGDPAFWHGVSLYTQRAIIESSKAKTLAAVGEDIGEANETKEKVDIVNVKMTKKDQEISVGSDGAIKIPAVATSDPTKSTGKIIFMPSALEGKQLHYSRNGGNKDFEYTFDAPAAGKYALKAKVVTPSWKQHLMVSSNGSKEPVDMELPHTVGMWDVTAPVVVELKKGKNVLKFSHHTDGYAKGFSIKEFTLTPQ